MKTSRPAKHFFFAFVLALMVYVVFYTAIERHRSERGPWEVTFASDAGSFPFIIIAQTNLNVTNMMIVFRQASTAPTNATLRFDQSKAVPFPTPFGECVFQDNIFQPGTVVLKMFGHEIQLMPRVLTIDKREQPWQSNLIINLKAQ